MNQGVEIPVDLRTRPRDKRGFYIPYVVAIARDGTPLFTTDNYEKVAEVTRKKLCALCGKKLRDGAWFIGGPRCFTDPNGAFIDPPSHRECAGYALRVCPYLAAPSYSKRIDGKTAKGVELPAGYVTVQDDQVPDGRPEKFGLGQTRSYFRVPSGQPGVAYFVIQKWEHIEYWVGGQAIGG